MATLKDISRHLGISVTQVSRALNGHADVSAKTRGAVASAARELGYSANSAARKLKSGRSGIVAMVLPAGSDHVDRDHLMEIVIGLAAQFSSREMQFVLHVMKEHDDEPETYRRLWRAGTLDGFVVLEPRPDDPRIALLRAERAPFIVHGRGAEAPDCHSVGIDDCAVGARLASCLVGAGHRRIALIDGPPSMPSATARKAGIERALAKAGLRLDPDLVRHGPMTDAAGAEAVERFWSGPSPTGLICGNLVLASGVMAGLGSRGIEVPGQVSLIAHDDVIARCPAEAFVPALTRTRAPLRDAWGPLADGLAAAVAGRQPGEIQRILPVGFVAGASLGSAPQT